MFLLLLYLSVGGLVFCFFQSLSAEIGQLFGFLGLMDSQCARPGLSLGFNSHASTVSRASAVDSPISLQIDSSFCGSSNSTLSGPLKLLEHKEEKIELEDGDDHSEDVKFSFMGQAICTKRPRNGQLLHCANAPKRLAVEPGLEARRVWENQPLAMADPEVHAIMDKERQRQFRGIELIASENFVCRAVMEALGSHLTNKYSEGMPGARYYPGNQHIDQIEFLCCERALVAFNLDPRKWGVNVQPYSCTSANFAVYTGLLLPNDRIMGLDSPSGGHLSHGYYTPSGKKVSATSIFFETLPYKVNPQTGFIDYEKLEEKALDFRPKILICGGSSYPREWDFARFRQIADKCGAVLMCDMAHISGLVAAKECASPFEYCDIVTSTTHKSLRGPRGGIIFYRRGAKSRKPGMHLNHGDGSTHYDFEERINFAVFPSLQGGPHNNHVAALAIALKQVATLEYKTYMQQVKKNAQAIACALLRRKCRLVTGGTDNHLLLWDLTPLGLVGKNYEKVCEVCRITINKSAIFGENGCISPGGVRIGTPAMTSRGCLEADFETIAEFLSRAAQITRNVQREHGKFPRDFLKGLRNNKDIAELQIRVEAFASQFAMPGFDI